MDSALQQLEGAVRRAAPDLTDEWEATAWVESLGWTDERARLAFGLGDTRALGRYIYERQPRGGGTVGVAPTADGESNLSIVIGAHSRTLIYALPWLMTFAAEQLWPDALDTRPEMAGPISVAVMISLIATGGYVQAIARKGSFYLGMHQALMARHVGLLLCRIGLYSTITLTALGLGAGLYFDIFGATSALLVALLYFVLLSTLWLACAMLSLQAPQWRVPMVYLAGGVVFVLAKVILGSSTLAAQTAALATAVTAACALTIDAFRQSARGDTRTEEIVLPRAPVMAQALFPHFVYGVAYFTFLFADRLSAGSALPSTSGLAFGIAPDYKRGIDLAFLVFLITAGSIESCALALMRSWRAAAQQPGMDATLAADLARLRRRAVIGIVVLFGGCAAVAAKLAADVQFLSGPGAVIFAAGCVGYLLFAVGLLDALTLFSVNRPFSALGALLPALFVNLVAGYVLSHIGGADYAVAGLMVGSAMFAFRARRAARGALREPAFAYAWA